VECLHIPQISYGAFCRRLGAETHGRRMPWLGSIELTARCNLRCVHCYINCAATDPAAEKRELTTGELQELIDQIESEQSLSILLTGGEPLIREDFLEIYTYVKKKGLLVTLFTNGTMITPEIADYLTEWPPRSVEITLYGATRQTYEAVTRIPGSHSRCLQGIRLLLERRIPIALKTVLLTVNRHELQAMRAYADGLGVSFRYDWNLNARLDGGKSPVEFRVSPEDVVSIERGDVERMHDLKQFTDRFRRSPLQPENLYFCGAGMTSFHVDPYGGLSVCLMSRVPSYDLREGTFRQGWLEFIPQVLSQKRRFPSPCQSCDLVFLCGQCPGWGRLESGDPERPVEYLCRLAHLRAEAIDAHKG
jgi:radical SAM protein with 4Fe4S-binding SPASM domain